MMWILEDSEHPKGATEMSESRAALSRGVRRCLLGWSRSQAWELGGDRCQATWGGIQIPADSWTGFKGGKDLAKKDAEGEEDWEPARTWGGQEVRATWAGRGL